MIKKIIFTTFMLLLCILSVNIQYGVYALSVDVSAKSAILISSGSKEVIFSKNENEKLSMASTTKIMTAVIALEYATTNNKDVAVTKEMITVEGTSMGLQEGDVLKLSDLVSGMMMVSGNDAANAIAMAIAGSQSEFSKLMNDKAKQIGMVNSHFITPSGLDDDCHYTTACDMALLADYAMQIGEFCSIVSQKSMKITFLNPSKTVTYTNHNKLLSMYDGCIGIKTGYTKKSGRCLVSCVEKQGQRFIAVTLNAPDDWNDHKKMYDYAFSEYENVVYDDTVSNYLQPVVGSDTDTVNVKADRIINITLKKSDACRVKKVVMLPSFSYAPIKAGDKLGTIEYRLDDKVLASCNLISTENALSNLKDNFFDYFFKLIGIK